MRGSTFLTPRTRITAINTPLAAMKIPAHVAAIPSMVKRSRAIVNGERAANGFLTDPLLNLDGPDRSG